MYETKIFSFVDSFVSFRVLNLGINTIRRIVILMDILMMINNKKNQFKTIEWTKYVQI